MNADDATRPRDRTDPLLRMDELCDQFEDELRDGRRPTVAEFLRRNGVDPTTAAPNFLADLERLATDYRAQAAAAAEPFAANTLLAGRYRVEAMLGKGGMGEVYRAHDLTLGQTVALKFLPVRLAADPARRAEFKQEVLVSRQVTHQNVCRVHDYAEHDGRPFFSMEYVGGGDLANLLQNAGQLSHDTAVKLARQLCRGLAAAHDRKLLHRDLKPQNILIDKGNAHIADFGLAGMDGSFSGDAKRAGTPLYQAPEQLAGTDVTQRSDIYALGLILYEMFTGKRAFEAKSVSELIQRHRDGVPTPSSRATGLNPVVEEVILKCLQPDPARRPASARQVLARLPGGDLFAEAIEDQQLPSPEVVADAPVEGRLSARVGLAVFAIAVVATLLVAWLNDFVGLFRQVPQDLSPRELIVRARDHLSKLGYGYDPRTDHTAHGVITDEPTLRRLRTDHPQALAPAVLRSGRPAVMTLWYRQSRNPLAQRLAANDTIAWSMPGRVLPNEPPLRDAGMTCLFLDLNGRLIEFHAVPDPTVPAPGKEIDPKVLLAAAGFAEGSLRESTEFHRTPPVFADTRLAWVGDYPDLPGVPVRVEAAFFRGRPFYFHVGLPTHANDSENGDRLPGFMPENLMEKVQDRKNTLLGLLALPIGGWFAWVNWKGRRANPFGATVLAVVFVVSAVIGWLFSAKHVADSADEVSMFCGMIGRALFDGGLMWLAYLALEPWVRQNSPWRLISWSRLTEGRWADPLVGRDVLTGTAVGAGFGLLLDLLRCLPRWFGDTPDWKLFWDATYAEGTGSLILTLQIGIMVALRSFFLFFLIALTCGRWTWLAAVLNAAVWAGLYQHGGQYLPVVVAVGLAFAAASYFVLYRAGLVGFIVFNMVEMALNYMPMTVDFSAWYTSISTQSILSVVGLTAFGAWAACRTRPAPNRATA